VDGFDVSAFTGEDGIVHVTVVQDGRAYEVSGQPTVTIDERVAAVDGRLGAPLHAVAPQRFVLELFPAQVVGRMVPARAEVQG
jgi:hypothetical protein